MSAPTAVVVGFDRFGGVGRIVSLLQQRGYHRVAVVLNAPEQWPELTQVNDVSLVKIHDPFSSIVFEQTVRAVPGFGSRSPFLCLTDKPMFAYVDAFERLVGTPAADGTRVPTEGIRSARMKPRARELWDAAGLKGPGWRVVSDDPARDTFWKQRGRLDQDDERRYVIKPIHGAGSESVTAVKGWQAALAAADSIRRQHPYHDSTPLLVGDARYVSSSDVLVEEEMQGPEYTVDGFVQDGVVQAIVQHKETRKHRPFFGDGLIVSPPDPAQGLADDWPGYQSQRHSGVEEGQFIQVLASGLRALQIDNWAFHAEMMVVDGNPQFVELNPRPAGGLLWQTAGLRLGVDPFEACIDLHLGRPVVVRRETCVTGQFPIYAERPGKINEVTGTLAARALAHVHDVRVAIPKEGIVVDELDREHYLAFVSLKAANHRQVRVASSQARRLLQVY